jgi:hypothetical protein
MLAWEGSRPGLEAAMVSAIDRPSRGALAALAIGAVLAGACDGGAGAPDASIRDLAEPPPVCVEGADAAVDPSFENVQRIFSGSCAIPGCHDGSSSTPPVIQDLRGGNAYASVVSVVATEQCKDGGTQLLVAPGDAGASYLFHKLTDDPPCFGSPMPKSDVPTPLPSCQLDLIGKWIGAGAPP